MLMVVCRADKERLAHRRKSLRFGIPQGQGMDACGGVYGAQTKAGAQFLSEKSGLIHP